MIKAHYEHALNNTSIEVIKERVFGGTYFSDTYSGVNPIQDGPFQGLSRMGGEQTASPPHSLKSVTNNLQ